MAGLAVNDAFKPGVEAEDDAGSDNDSAFYDNVDDLTTSISSSILAYQVEHGRRYHAYKAGKYVLPNDEDEQDRLDLAYHAWRMMFGGKPFFAPVGKPQAVLDVGTGTGIWAIDVADEYPSVEVIGTDLSPIQPKWVPPNVKFEIDDCEQEWTYPPNRFDLIHTRITNGFAVRDWTRFYKQSIRTLKPGGWVESQEFDFTVKSDDGTLPPDSVSLEWCNRMVEGSLLGGFHVRLTSKDLVEAMEAAGFVEVTAKEFKLPMGPWAKDTELKNAGTATLMSMLEGAQGVSLAIFTRYLGWSPEELEVFLVDVRKEWKKKSIHSYWPCFAVYGKKPETETAK